MPTKERKLKATALEGAKWRGHKMPYRWEHLNPHCWCKECKVCGYEVVVDTKPAPNGIDIGGKAVALTCSSKGA